MRAPDDLPRRRPRRSRSGSSNRRRIVLVAAAAIALFLLLSLRGMAGFYTDYLWFDSLGQWGTRRAMLEAQLSLALIFITAFFLLAWVNLYMAERLAPPFRPAGPEDELLERYHDLVAGRLGRVHIGVAMVLALIAGSGASSEWNSWVLFRNGGSFGVEDPEFGRDVSFYVFQLPFLSFVVDWLFASLLIVIIITAVAHYLNGGIRVQPGSPRVTPQVKAHLSVLLAILALVKTADYYLQRFELTSSTRGVVDGASYTDVKAELPALNLLVLISVAAALLFVANIFRRGWALPVVAVALWAFVALIVGGVYPELVQYFQVRPNESAKEREYIERNITATRAAMGVQGIDPQSFVPEPDPAQIDLAASQPTIRNIRLWDPTADISGKVFQQLQGSGIRDYYRISDIDVDRYQVNGQVTQMELGVRTINPERIPGDSWENEHLAYTHGYGVVAAPSNASAGRQPDFVVRDIPTDSPGGDLAVEQPGIYIGEEFPGYSIVGTQRDEIDFQGDEGPESTRYEGDDGVEVGSFVRRAAFALRFGDINPLISDFLTDESRVIYVRDVKERVEMLAPFLEADADPYPVLLDGRVLWVVDLYTTTDRYPYSQRAESDQVSDESGLDQRFNYVRNSVKATVDAYDGTVRFYRMPSDDPILDAYSKAFPDLFSDYDEMPAGLEQHLRYPEDLFRVQTAAWERYHLGDPGEFYEEANSWRVARDPGTAGDTGQTQTTTEDGAVQVTNAPIAPYYQLLQLPGEAEAEFVLMRPFVPFSEDDRSQLMTAFMAARMDPGHYGELMVYTMPPSALPPGPGVIAGSISANGEVARFETDTDQRGSNLLRGNLLLLPIGDALLYVQPLYTEAEAEARQIPRLERVVAVLPGGRGTDGDEEEDQVVMAETLQGALEQLFGDDVVTQEDPDATGEDPTEPEGTAEERASALLAEAEELFVEADQALSEGDLATYQDRIEEGRAKVQEAVGLLDGAGATTEGGATTTTTASGGDQDADGSASPSGSASDTTTTTATTRPA